MDVRVAARKTLELVDLHYKLRGDERPPSERQTEGNTIPHAEWIVEQVAKGNVCGDKAHRWLGYGQGVLVVLGVMTLSQAKLINYDSKRGRREPSFMPRRDK